MILEKKKQQVEDLSKKINGAAAIVLADFRGLTVEQVTELRSAFRKAGVEYKVIKNTLAKFAFNENGITGLDKYLEGPTAMAVSSDIVAPAKVMSEYAKKFDKLTIKAGMVEKSVIDVDGVKALAELPSKEVLIARMLGSFNAPITGFVNVLNANLRGLVTALDAIRQKQEV